MSKQTDMEDPTKRNYEEAHSWHAEKSATYNWVPQIEKFLQQVGNHDVKVLDVGCGDGRDVRTFTNMGIAVEGLDYSKSAIASLRQQFPGGTFYEASMLSTDLPDEKYGGVWACASVLNLQKSEVPEALREFNRVLRKGGALFVSVKEGEGERMVPDKAGERFFSFYSVEEINAFVESSGFKVVQTEVMDDTFSSAAPGVVLPRWISVYAKKI